MISTPWSAQSILGCSSFLVGQAIWPLKLKQIAGYIPVSVHVKGVWPVCNLMLAYFYLSFAFTTPDISLLTFQLKNNMFCFVLVNTKLTYKQNSHLVFLTTDAFTHVDFILVRTLHEYKQCSAALDQVWSSCLHLSCSPSTVDACGLNSQREETPMQAKWIKLDLVQHHNTFHYEEVRVGLPAH